MKVFKFSSRNLSAWVDMNVDMNVDKKLPEIPGNSVKMQLSLSFE